MKIFLMVVNGILSMVVPDKGIAMINVGVVIFMALSIWNEEDPKEKEKKDSENGDYDL